MTMTRKFLLVADGSDESRMAAYFAARRARNTGGAVTILAVAEADGSGELWLGVGEAMRAEALTRAETALECLAEDVEEVTGARPEVILREGVMLDELRKLISEDDAIAILVLGAAPEGDGPGPLVAGLARGKGLFDERVIPVTVIPAGLTREQLKALA
ncbi:RNA methyltransferase [Alkalicaulis satelles]|uniref:RNA methyltransferase n=1 Tax=Alkalicaulis satelles TaxID=2609175 RepID=A0A5M6ZL64_9PROT|nr:universal stress protein [Alkalicaulis satelles]KAA5803958.1 RNA methyltransferase [Alkalicaulis satelles]